MVPSSVPRSEDLEVDLADPSSGEEATILSPEELRGLRRGRTLGWLLFALTGAGLAAALARSLDEGEKAKVEVARARDEAAELRTSLFRAEDRFAKAETESKEKAAAAEALVAKASAQEAAHAETDSLIADLRSKLDAKDGEVSTEANRITVSLVDEILFPSAEAELSTRGQELLTKLGGVLKGLKDKQIVIGGHTDDMPIHTEEFPSNWELSAARAVNVVRHLVETVGVDPHRIAATGYSQYRPRSTKVKAKNRRIEVLLTPLLDVKKG